MEDDSEFIGRVCAQIYQAYLDGYSRFEVPGLIGPDFRRCANLLAERLHVPSWSFDLIDYTLLQNPPFPIQPWELEAMRRIIARINQQNCRGDVQQKSEGKKNVCGDAS